MISKKYLKDYRLEEKIDGSGRVKTKAVYIGGDYTVSPDFQTGKKRLLLSLSVLSGLIFTGALTPVSLAARIIYVILPFVFSALPLSFMITTAFSLFRAKGIMRREQAERIAYRLPVCTLAVLILTGVSFSGHIITAVVSWDSIPAGDIIYSMSLFVIIILSAISFIKCKGLKAVALENHSVPPGK